MVALSRSLWAIQSIKPGFCFDSLLHNHPLLPPPIERPPPPPDRPPPPLPIERPPPPYELELDLVDGDEEKLEDCLFDVEGDCLFDADGDCLVDILLDMEGLCRFEDDCLFDILFDTDGD